jgi:hypothetical protein
MPWVIEFAIAFVAAMRHVGWIISTLLGLGVVCGFTLGRIVVTYFLAIVMRKYDEVPQPDGHTVRIRSARNAGLTIFLGSVTSSLLLVVASFFFATAFLLPALLVAAVDVWGNYLSARCDS